MLHKDSLAGNIHTLANWIVADAAARAALVLVAADVGKVCQQTDTKKFYILEDDSPATWQILDSKFVVPNRTHVTRASTDQSISATTQTSISFDTEVADTAAGWVVGTPTRITVPAGYTKIKLTAGVIWASNSSGRRQLYLVKNGATNIAFDVRTATNNAGGMIMSPWLVVVAGDYFTLDVWQDSGGALNLFGSSGISSWLEAEFAE